MQEGTTVDSIHTVERMVKIMIYPKIKFFSDNEDDYDQPDFVAGRQRKQQSIGICNTILKAIGKDDYSLKQKIMWWVAYRKVIKTKVCKLRQANVRKLQMLFLECKFNQIKR